MKFPLSILIFAASFLGNAQGKINQFLKPADSLSFQRRNFVVGTEAVVATGAIVGLSALWYNGYPKSDFHFINDNAEWLQMDKAGHVFSSYHMGRFGAELLQWSGANKKSQLIYGSTIGFAFLSVVEVMDGYSSEWGASWGDVAANATGTVLYVSQELIWKEQRITPKFSFHKTVYASARPNVLGSSLQEQILKDYNGQTYWLSANIHSFFKESKIPGWLNFAVGYGAEGMVTGKEGLINTIFLPEKERIRQFYLSFDVDLTKINTKSNLLKSVFSVFNTIKIPAPTFEINSLGKAKFHALYF
ncbi:DUF2279 domain-containing protein [Flavobacterium sp. 3HN19-14]|uniref:DUF2279 domain-containing protein n=1 Tax=Flavobacterium sp. 3HN19-14 TaxID=3448133 RepID=UPI003EE3A70D